MSNETADILDRAADALWMYGRGRGLPLNVSSGAMCALGAIQHAIDPDLLTAEVTGYDITLRYPEVVEALAETLPEVVTYDNDRAASTSERVWSWNDRTDDDAEVIDTIRRCAKDLRNNTGAGE